MNIENVALLTIEKHVELNLVFLILSQYEDDFDVSYLGNYTVVHYVFIMYAVRNYVQGSIFKVICSKELCFK